MSRNEKPERRLPPVWEFHAPEPTETHRQKLAPPLTDDPTEDLQHLFWSFYVCWLREALVRTKDRNLTQAPIPVMNVDEETGYISIDFVIAEVTDAYEFYRNRFANFMERNIDIQ